MQVDSNYFQPANLKTFKNLKRTLSQRRCFIEENLALLESEVLEKMGDLPPRQISSILHAVGVKMQQCEGVRMPIRQSLLEALERRAELIWGQFNAAEISGVLTAYGRMRCAPPERLMDLLERRAEVVAGVFTAQHVSAIMRAYAKLQRLPAESCLMALERRGEGIWREFHGNDVSSTLKAYAKLDRLPAPRMLGALLQRAEDICTEEFSMWDVADFMWSCATLDAQPGEGVVCALERRIEEIVHDFEAIPLSNTLWAYGKLGQQPRAMALRALGGDSSCV